MPLDGLCAMCCFFSKEHAAAIGRAQARALAEILKSPIEKDPPGDGRLYEAQVVGPRRACLD